MFLTISDDWNSVVRKQFISADLDNSYLHLITNSTKGNNDEILIRYFDKEGSPAGGISIWYSNTTAGYWLLECRYRRTSFPINLPAERDKVLTIEKHGYKNALSCNGEKVLAITVSSETCNDKWWDSYWGQKVSKIQFDELDSASDSYMIGEFF